MASNCRSANCKMTKWKIVAICGTALLIAAAVVVVVASRNRQQPALPLDVPVSASSAEVRVKAVVQKSATVGRPKSLSGVSLFGKTNLGFPVKLIHRNTGQAIAFRKWANQIVSEYTIKGWVMDVPRLKDGIILECCKMISPHHSHLTKGDPRIL